MSSPLDFEQPIVDLEAKIEELRRVDADGGLDLQREIDRLQQKSIKLTREVFSSLSAWQITQVARHPQRPHTLDYIPKVFSHFQELSGDRMYRNDLAIVGGLARINGSGVVVIGHQKGRDTKEKVRRNFGMPGPEGYRKAQRLMRMAERFQLPVVTLIDTPGAYPGIGAEERGQSEAIARSISVMAGLSVPIVSVVIGEGGSGGALAIGEPLGGAHRNISQTAEDIQEAIGRHLSELRALAPDALRAARDIRLRSFGKFRDA
ncbi:MAG: acetyl-CoA carboxylase carboxyl transferase subunit alpha [Gammaproteobacteria bacterium]|nr:acetyl-CoA carboxylase carboxyl transferase subunit alpha [Gammaproteobacteria bacterium]